VQIDNYTTLSLKDQVRVCCLNNIKDGAVSSWFNSKLKTIDSTSAFFMTFGMVNKKIERVAIEFSEEQLSALKSFEPEFKPELWTLDQLCRLALLLSLDPATNRSKIETLIDASDMRELVTIYKSLLFLNNAKGFIMKVVDGIRTNMIDVFDSIALNNSYPSKYFTEDAWNQVVLKAIFMERPIYKIVGLEKRNNQKLADILHDYAHERWAAGRRVTPELWRMISGYLNDEKFADLKKVIDTDVQEAKAAAIKVIEESHYSLATDWLAEQNIPKSNLSWEDIGNEVWSKNQE
jgi:hypothetical protein